MQSLPWTLTKLYFEAPPQTSWNYVLSMRHHHELPLTRIMELHPEHEAPPRNHHGIMSWPMRHHHEISPRDLWNYVLTNKAPPRNYRGITSWPHQHHVPSTNIKSLFIPIPCHFDNQPSHTCYMLRSCQTHQSSP